MASTLNGKGQASILKQIRDAIGLTPVVRQPEITASPTCIASKAGDAFS